MLRALPGSVPAAVSAGRGGPGGHPSRRPAATRGAGPTEGQAVRYGPPLRP
jgi:hypothetical protein